MENTQSATETKQKGEKQEIKGREKGETRPGERAKVWTVVFLCLMFAME